MTLEELGQLYKTGYLTLDEVRKAMGLEPVLEPKTYQLHCKQCDHLNVWKRDQIAAVYGDYGGLQSGVFAVPCEACRRLHVMHVLMDPVNPGYHITWGLVSTAAPDEREASWAI